MTVKSAIVTFSLPWAGSLKDKRQVRRSLIDRARQRFNVAIAEVATQELHQTLTLGFAVVSGEPAHAQQQLEEVLRFLESATEAELVSVVER